jgi:hypothetical protein
VSPVPHWAELAWTNFGGGGAGIAPKPKAAVVKAVSSNVVLSSGLSLANTAPSALIANSPWRVASLVFRDVLQNSVIPDFLSPNLPTLGTAIVNDSDHPLDTANHWGVNAAQTAYILFRLPFRVLVQAKLMLPQS